MTDGEREAGLGNVVEAGLLTMARSALNSVEAVLGGPPPGQQTAAEREYDAVVASVTGRAAHEQAPAPRWLEEQGIARLYTVTTIAASARYGGTRTPVVCSSWERAREIVEANEGDIWESSYMLAVIEAVAADCLYGGGLDERYWYAWDLGEGRYRPVEPPAAYAGQCGFGIG